MPAAGTRSKHRQAAPQATRKWRPSNLLLPQLQLTCHPVTVPATAGVGRMMVNVKGDKDDIMGGFATEYKGHAQEDLAKKELESALEGE